MRNLVFAAVLGLVIVVAALVVLGHGFSQTACFGCGGTAIVSSGPVTCGVENESCEITLFNGGNAKAQAVACSFRGRNTPQSGNGTSEVFTVTGVLSYETGGPAITIFIPAGSSVTVYCSGYSGWLEQGAQVDGTVQISTGDQTSFTGAWQ